MVFYSKQPFRLYSERFHPLPVTEGEGLHTAQVTRLVRMNEVVVASPDGGVRLVLTVVREPISRPFSYYLLGRKMGSMMRVSSIPETVVVESCEGWHPVLGLWNRHRQIKELIEWREGNCYIELEEYNVYG